MNWHTRWGMAMACLAYAHTFPGQKLYKHTGKYSKAKAERAKAKRLKNKS